jgi:hypothetical protein
MFHKEEIDYLGVMASWPEIMSSPHFILIIWLTCLDKA